MARQCGRQVAVDRIHPARGPGGLRHFAQDRSVLSIAADASNHGKRQPPHLAGSLLGKRAPSASLRRSQMVRKPGVAST
jgi:hypothetical protein